MAGLEVRLQATGPIRMEAAFDCGPGELVALVGPSGSGKTSMLRAVAGLWTPHRLQGRIACGDVVWFDTAQGVQLPPQQRRVGLVFQHYALFPHMDVARNVAFGLQHLDKAGRQQRVQEVLEPMRDLVRISQRLKIIGQARSNACCSQRDFTRTADRVCNADTTNRRNSHIVRDAVRQRITIGIRRSHLPQHRRCRAGTPRPRRCARL